MNYFLPEQMYNTEQFNQNKELIETQLSSDVRREMNTLNENVEFELHRVVLCADTDVSEGHDASIFRTEN
jgi:hypothetical protein